MTNCIEQLAPILSQAEQHPDHGGVMTNAAIATFYDVDAGSIRTLKKRLTDEQSISEDKHWLKGPSNKTLWTFRGFIRLGMRLSSPVALQLQQGLEDLLVMLNDGRVSIVPMEGQAIGVELVTVATAIETTETAIEVLPLAQDETALGHALGAAKYEQERQAQAETVERIKSAAMARYAELKQGEADMGESLAQSLGLPMETVATIMGAA